MKKGKQSVLFQKDIFINDATSYVGKRESEGNLRDYFQNVLKDDLMKEKSYELAETKMQKMTVEKLLEVSGKTANDFDCIMGGDLQNQIFATSFCAREFDIPLGFLPEGTFMAKVYADAPDAHYLTNPQAYSITEQTVSSADSLHVRMAPGGGFAISFEACK